MDPKLLAEKLSGAIEAGDLSGVKSLLDPLTDYEEIVAVQDAFEDRDPVVFAIENGEEMIATYLIEKYFTFNNVYYKPGEECEPWCYALHQGKKCPSQYDALKLATEKNLAFVEKLMTEIRNGSRTPGESLKTDRRVSVDSLSDFAEKRASITEKNFKRRFSTQEKYETFCMQLDDLFVNGDLNGVRKLMDPIVQIEDIEAILQSFGDRDPIARAIDCGQEKIACYLVEKNFPRHVCYNNPGVECDEWCYSMHGGCRCPNQYTVLDLARRKNMTGLEELIQNIEKGKWKPGDGLKFSRRVSMDRLPSLPEMPKSPSKQTKIARDLEDFISLGDLNAVKDLLSPVNTKEDIAIIVKEFDQFDPVTYAVDCVKEDVACFLVEKGFPFNKTYNYPGQECDQWCYALHDGKRCPAIYDAKQMAKERDLRKLCSVMEVVASH